MTEWAIMFKGEIVNVCTTDGPKPAREDYVDRNGEIADDIVDLALLPDSVKQRYRYWDERP